MACGTIVFYMEDFERHRKRLSPIDEFVCLGKL